MLIGTGLGDGGGGPSEAEAERARRFRDLAGSPRHAWRTSASFFAELERVRDRLPVYQGELYMEAHRGVLTSQAEYKRLYRACEVALQTHEGAARGRRRRAARRAGVAARAVRTVP